MRITLSFLFFCILFSSASNSYSQKFTIKSKTASIKEVCKEIEKGSDYVFIFSDNCEKLIDKQVNVEANSKDVTKVLNAVLSSTGLTYKILDKQIVVYKSTEATPSVAVEQPDINITQQPVKRQITGKVVDAQGEAIIGANIIETGTTNGTVTDIDGNFSLDVGNNATIRVSYIGYLEQSIATAGQSTFNITLQEDTHLLEEVVAIGYGTTRKVTVTGSVTSVKGSEIVKAPVTNVSNSLVGLLPGLSSIQRSGEPGNDGSTIRIRGVNTIGDNSALIVVDGVPGRSLERINPSSIETITILKDASAAIYGSQAANGVILITTKRGVEGKPRITVNFNQGINRPTRIPKMANAAEYATMLNEIDTYRGNLMRYTQEEIKKFEDGSDPWKYPNTDWFKEVLKPWSSQNDLNTSISGGGEKWKYFISLGTKFQDGYYYKSATYYKQHDFLSNLDLEISKDINVRFDISGRMEDSNYPTRGAGAIFRMLVRGKPIYPGYWPDGTPGPDLEYGDNPVVVSTDATGYDREKIYVFNSNIRLDISIPWIEGLSLNGNASFDKNFGFRKRFETPWHLYSWDYKSYDSENNPILIKGKKGFEDPRLQEWMNDNQIILLNGIMDYTKKWNLNNIKMMIGSESRVRRGDSFDAYRRFFISTTVDELFAGGDKDKNNSGSSFENARLNYFGRLNYNYNEKYLFEFVWRYDGSYIFPRQGRFGFFPGISLGWRASEEKFWQENIPFFTNFKLRGSWGRTGNDRIAEWQYLSSYAFNSSGRSYIFGHTSENKLLSEQRIPNPDITWEIANQSNIGFETYTLNDKLSIETDFFYNKRSNILWQRNASVPASTGLILPRENIGKVTSKGFEYNISYQDSYNQINYRISLNGGYASNKITFWDEVPGAPDYQRSTGKPIPTSPNNINSDLYYEAIGIFRDQAAINSYPHWPGARPGDIIFKDVNDDGKIDANDRVRSNKTNIPKFTGGLNFYISYHQFDLSVLFQGAAGAVRYIKTESGEIGNFLKDFYDKRWTENNPDAKGPRTFIDSSEYWRNYNNTYDLHKTDYIRLKNIEIGYNFPSLFTNKIGIENMRLYINGYNLLTISPDLKDFDPESDNERGQSYPVQKILNAGISLTF